jgi:hypothetical protein
MTCYLLKLRYPPPQMGFFVHPLRLGCTRTVSRMRGIGNWYFCQWETARALLKSRLARIVTRFHESPKLNSPTCAWAVV